MTTKHERDHMHELMTLLLHHEPQVHYPRHDIRGSADAATFRLSEASMRRKLATGGTLMMDCSQAVTQICKWAGLDDPNGLGYRYAGYTGTLLHHLRRYSDPAAAYVGAIIVFGPATGEHAAMVCERGKDPLCWGHGFDGGPKLERLSVIAARHRKPVTLCSIAKL